jgi:hypothetical protein
MTTIYGVKRKATMSMSEVRGEVWTPTFERGIQSERTAGAHSDCHLEIGSS